MSRPSRLARLAESFVGVRGDELIARLDAQLERQPRCPVARYLAGCECFERARPALDVRHFMLAYHAQPDLQSAALLAFAGLNWVSRPRVPLLAVLLETWEEFRRPEFDRTHRERALLDVLADPLALPAGQTELALRLWRIPIRVLRAQIREALVTRDTELRPLLLAGA